MADHYPTFTPEELQNEIWKPVPAYESLYSVSNLGRVRRDCGWNAGHLGQSTRKAGHLLKPNRTVWGYVMVSLCEKSVVRRFSVHRLVMLAFTGERPKGKEINHKDADRMNNRLTNLEYITHKENLAHGRKMGRINLPEHYAHLITDPARGQRNGNSRLTEIQVREIKALLMDGVSRQAIKERFNVSKSTIQCIASGDTWTHIT